MTTPQEPIGSGHDAFTTARDILAGQDLSGRVALVTGGYSGLGLEMTRVLSLAGARVIVPARSPAKAKSASLGLDRVTILPLDLADVDATHRFADQILQDEARLDILIHSAGIMAAPLSRDAQGRELQFAINHLAAFRLTGRLMPLLAGSGAARVVSLSSRAHRLGGIDFDDPFFERRAYDPWKAYAQSKTANALFARELDRRGAEHGIRAFSVHPGSILTDLARHLTHEQIAAFGAYDEAGAPRIDPERDLKSVPQGAATAIWCATSPALAGMGGVYCENSDIAPLRAPEDPRLDGVRPWAADDQAAERLWALSEALEERALA